MVRVLLAVLLAAAAALAFPSPGAVAPGVPSYDHAREMALVRQKFAELKAKPMESLSAGEAFLMGVAYFEGLPEAGLRADPIRAREYFLASSSKGYGLAAVHVLLSDLRADRPDLFSGDANDLLREPFDRETKRSLLKVVSGKAIEMENYRLAAPFLKMLADYYGDAGAAVTLAVIYQYGLAGDRMPEMAGFYLNKGCASRDAAAPVRDFCAQFRKR